MPEIQTPPPLRAFWRDEDPKTPEHDDTAPVRSNPWTESRESAFAELAHLAGGDGHAVELLASFESPGVLNLRGVRAQDIEAWPPRLLELLDAFACSQGASGIESLQLAISAHEAQDCGVADNPFCRRLAPLLHLDALTIALQPPPDPPGHSPLTLLNLCALTAVTRFCIEPVPLLAVHMVEGAQCTATRALRAEEEGLCFVQPIGANGVGGRCVPLAPDTALVQAGPAEDVLEQGFAATTLPGHGQAREPEAVAPPSGRAPTEVEKACCAVISWMDREMAVVGAAQDEPGGDGRMRPTVTASALSRWDAISRSRPTAICHFQQFYNALRARCGDPVQPAGQVTKVFAFQFGGYPFAMRATLSPGREAGAGSTLETTVFNGATGKLVNLRPPDAKFNACWLPLDLRDAWRGAASALALSTDCDVVLWEVGAQGGQTSCDHIRALAPAKDSRETAEAELAVSCAAVRAGLKSREAAPEAFTRHMQIAGPAVVAMAYHTALAQGRLADAEALMNACQADRLPLQLLFRLLEGRGVRHAQGATAIESGAIDAMLAGRAGVAPAYFRRLQAIDDVTGEATHRMIAFSQGVPVLHRLCAGTDVPAHAPALRYAQQQCVHDATVALVGGGSQEDVECGGKAYQCAPIHRGKSPAQTALDNGNPGAAAAMLCGVLESRKSVPVRRFIAIAKIPVREILQALRAHPLDAMWDRRLRALIKKCGGLDMLCSPEIDDAAIARRWSGHRPVAFTGAATFGVGAAILFDRMAAGGGSSYAVVDMTDDPKVIDMTLSRSGDSYVVDLHDHAHLRRLRVTCANRRQLMLQDFGKLIGQEARTLAMMRGHFAPEPGAAEGRPARDVPECLTMDRRQDFIFAGQAAVFGDNEFITSVWGRPLDGNPHSPQDLLESITNALDRAMWSGQTATAGLCLRTVLDAPPQRWSAQQKLNVLSGNVVSVGGVSAAGNSIGEAIVLGHSGTVKEVARIVAGAKAQLGPERAEFLHLRRLLDSDGRPAGMSFIHALCASNDEDVDKPQFEDQFETDARIAARDEALCAYLGAIVASPALTLGNKDLICGARVGEVSAMMAALANDHPCTAAAIACAVLEQGIVVKGRDEAVVLMRRFKVEVGDIEAALEGDLSPHADSWLKRLRSAAALHPELVPAEAVPVEEIPAEVVAARGAGQDPVAIAVVEEVAPRLAARPLHALDNAVASVAVAHAPVSRVRAVLEHKAVVKAQHWLHAQVVFAWMKELVAARKAGRPGVLKHFEDSYDTEGRAFFVPRFGYPHLHINGTMIELRNGNGGGTKLIHKSGLVKLDTLEGFLEEDNMRPGTLHPDVRTVLEFIKAKALGLEFLPVADAGAATVASIGERAKGARKSRR